MIDIKFDNTLQFPSIEVPIYNETHTNDPLYGNDGGNIQTKTDGIFCPLFRLNNMTIPFQQVVSMYLYCDTYPKIRCVINDNLGLIKTLDNPSNDNMLQMQILPSFDNAYKKINLTFFITELQIYGSRIDITGVYNVPKIWDTCMDAFGNISSYELFETIAKKYSLGFCSNINGTPDKRYIYSTNTNILSLMEKEITYSGDKEHVYDFWIDYWNNINFIDLYNEYKLNESEENMQIYIEEARHTTNDSTDSYTPTKVLAMISNAPFMTQSPLYVTSYTPMTSSVLSTDKIIEIFNFDTKKSENIVVVDGDIKNDIFKEYVYFGENFGEYEYLYHKATRDMFLSKIKSQTLQVKLSRPILGLMKGGKLIFYWYDINQYMAQDAMKHNETIKSNVSMPDNIVSDDAEYVINASVSGQYYIIDSSISYASGRFEHILTLGRYADKINKYNE